MYNGEYVSVSKISAVHTCRCKGKGVEGCPQLVTYEEEIGNGFL